jgi:hypothetical protein
MVTGSVPCGANVCIDAQLLMEFAAQTGFQPFAWFDFPSGKFPFECKIGIAPALADEPLAGTANEAGNHGDVGQ